MSNQMRFWVLIVSVVIALASGAQIGAQTSVSKTNAELRTAIEQHMDAHSPDPDTSAKLRQTLGEFARKNKLTEQQVQQSMSAMVLSSTGFNEGGLGIVDNRHTYVVLDTNSNQAIVGKTRWNGAASSQAQLVITDGGKVVTTLTYNDLSNLRILLFSPSEVRYIDLSNNWGGRYERIPTKRISKRS